MNPAEFTKSLEERVDRREFSSVGEVVLYAQDAGFKVSGLSWTANTPMPAWKDQLFAETANKLLILPTKAKLDELAALAHSAGYWPSGMTLEAAAEASSKAQGQPRMILADGNGSTPTASNGQPIQVHVHPQITVMAPQPPDVHVHVPEQPAPVVNVHTKPPDVNVAVAPAPPDDVEVERNRDGSIRSLKHKPQQ